MNAPDEHVTITEITRLTAWLRRLSDAGPDGSDPAELATFHATKTTLLARTDNQHTPGHPDHRHAARPDKDTR